MDKKTKIQEDSISFLRSYLRDTPNEIFKKEIAEISKINFVGTSAKDYFLNFHNHYLGFDIRKPEVEIPSTKAKVIA